MAGEGAKQNGHNGGAKQNGDGINCFVILTCPPPDLAIVWPDRIIIGAYSKTTD